MIGDNNVYMLTEWYFLTLWGKFREFLKLKGLVMSWYITRVKDLSKYKIQGTLRNYENTRLDLGPSLQNVKGLNCLWLIQTRGVQVV